MDGGSYEPDKFPLLRTMDLMLPRPFSNGYTLRGPKLHSWQELYKLSRRWYAKGMDREDKQVIYFTWPYMRKDQN